MSLAKSHMVLFETVGQQISQVTVCISLYNYQDYIIETLESVYRQTLATIDLLIVDDGSVDHSTALAQQWLEQRQARFNAARLIRHVENSGLAAARNTAIDIVETPFVFILDADNHLYPRCVSRCLEVLEATDAAFAYPLIEQFDGVQGIIGNLVWSQERLAQQNYIDAMSLVRRSAVLSVGGYTPMRGWEDYDLWCKLAEQGQMGILVPEILARYRVHPLSMLRGTTNRNGTIEQVKATMLERHPWMKFEAAGSPG
jgi:glycosyltransferase involved in cell wall biosynthesis